MRLRDAILGRIPSAALATSAVLAACAVVSPAMASPPPGDVLTITVLQNGPDVTMSYTGAINLFSLTALSPSNDNANIYTPFELLVIGGTAYPASTTNYDVYSGASQTSLNAAFSSGGNLNATSASGSIFGLYGNTGQIDVPTGYVSGTTISGSATYAGETLGSLHLSIGNYSQSYGVGNHIVLNISNAVAVPEPASLGLLAAGIAGIGAARRRKRA